MDLAQLNREFAIGDAVRFAPGPGGLPVAEIRNGVAAASVCLHGGHVMTFQPRGAEPVLWMSKHSRFEAGHPIRGGIPICWPWFGPHPSDAQQPIHGFARRSVWEVAGAEARGKAGHLLRLRLADSPDTRRLWPHAFRLEIGVSVGAELGVELLVTNTGGESWPFTAALHTYLNVRSATDIAVEGLDGCAYIDTVGTPTRRVQRGGIRIEAETDRIYLDTAAACVVSDPGFRRRIRVAKAGSRTTVVWNPWIAKSARMPDFGDEEYRTMVCVETANAEGDARTLAPGETHRLQAVIGVEPLA